MVKGSRPWATPGEAEAWSQPEAPRGGAQEPWLWETPTPVQRQDRVWRSQGSYRPGDVSSVSLGLGTSWGRALWGLPLSTVNHLTCRPEGPQPCSCALRQLTRLSLATFQKHVRPMHAPFSFQDRRPPRLALLISCLSSQSAGVTGLSHHPDFLILESWVPIFIVKAKRCSWRSYTGLGCTAWGLSGSI